MRLHVTVQLHDELIEDVVVPIKDGMRLGAHPCAAVAFPGDDVLVQRGVDRVMVGDQWLIEGQRLQLGANEISVCVTPVAQERLDRGPLWRGDIRLAVALAAVAVLALSAQTFQQVMHAKADVSEGVVNRVEALLLPERVRVQHVDEPTVFEPEVAHETPTVHYIEQTTIR